MDWVGTRIIGCHFEREGHGLGRIAHVFVERAASSARRIEAKRSAFAKIQGPRGRLPARPSIKAAPLMRPHLEDMSFAGGIISVAFEKMPEKRQFDFFLIEFGSLRAKADVPK